MSKQQGEYDALQETCDFLAMDLVPKLTGENVERAVGALNTLVGLQRPREWAHQGRIREILGITSDGEKIVYVQTGTLGLYEVSDYDTTHEMVSHMVEKARESYENHRGTARLSSRVNHDIYVTRGRNLRHTEGLLERLENLRKTPQVA